MESALRGTRNISKVEAMRTAQRPPDMTPDEEATYELVTALLGPPDASGDRIPDALYEKAKRENRRRGPREKVKPAGPYVLA